MASATGDSSPSGMVRGQAGFGGWGREHRRLEYVSRSQRFVPAVGSSWAEKKENKGEIADLKVSDLEGLN